MNLLKILFSLFLIIPFYCFSQQNSTDDVGSIAASLITNLRQKDKERILLHTDKKIYIQGETIWFKAFVVDSLENRVTYKNKILYVDLVNDKDSVISVLLLHANTPSINGSIILNDSSLQGYYWLRAYTRKMINENIDNIGLQPVYVLNSRMKNNLEDDKKSNATGDAKISAHIFPEGGWLMSGINSVVALRLHDQNNDAVVADGIVKDNRDTVVAKFTSNTNGLAKFSFSPTWYGKYKVFILDKGKYDTVGVLPPVNPYSAQLSVVEQNDQSVKIRVMLEDSVYSNNYATYILGVSKDSLCFAGVGSGTYELNIPVSNFPGGVAKLILFNAKKEFISERNIYINKKNVNVNITTDKQNYAARENAKLNIGVTDGSGKPLLSALSVSVIDSRVADTANKSTDNKFAELSAEDVDLFMLTQKPEVQSWMEPGNEMKHSVVANDTLMLKGTILNKKREPGINVPISLISNKDQLLFLVDTSDNEGRFSFTLPDYNDGTPFNLQVSDQQQLTNKFNFILDKPDSLNFSTPVFLKEKFYSNGKPFSLETKANYLDSIISGTGWLLPVSVKNTQQNENFQKKNPANIITGEMISESGVNSVGEAVLRTGKFHLIGGFLMSGGPNGMYGPSVTDEPMIIMDGVQIQPEAGDPAELSPVLAFLKSLDPEQIDYIRILTDNEAAVYGVRGGHGVIEIHSARNVKNTEVSNAVKTIYPKGFYVPIPFDMPDYNNKEIKNSKNHDLRTTIYWNGDIFTDKDGKASVNFFTADAPATYIVIVRGITANGDKIYKTATINRR